MPASWLENNGDTVSGYQDTIILPYDKMMECLHESTQKNEPVIWKALSIDDSVGQARFVFKSRKNLHAALENGVIRHKLIRFLRDQFRRGHSEKIEIYDDFVPYSFYLLLNQKRECRNFRRNHPARAGGYEERILFDAYIRILTV